MGCLLACLLLAVAAGGAEAAQERVADLETGPDGVAVYSHLGVTLRSAPRFLSTDRTRIVGFEITAVYHEIGTSFRSKWIDRSFISTVHERERAYGPFRNVRGANFQVHARTLDTAEGPAIEFRLACDNLELEERYYSTFGEPQIELIFGRIDYPGVLAAKRAYAVYSTVTLVYKVGQLAAGVLKPEVFVVSVLLDVSISFLISQIPDHYVGAVSYHCRFCGETRPLEEIRGCRIVECCDGIIRSEVCKIR